MLGALKARGLWPTGAVQRGAETALDSARRLVVEAERRAESKRAPWRETWVFADHIRLAFRAADVARTSATTLGDGPAAWRLAELAAEAEREALALETMLDQPPVGSPR